MTITIELPEDVAERLRAAAAHEGQDVNDFAITALTEAADAVTGESDPDLLAALRESIADKQAGHLRTLEQVDATVEDALAARPGRNPARA